GGGRRWERTWRVLRYHRRSRVRSGAGIRQLPRRLSHDARRIRRSRLLHDRRAGRGGGHAALNSADRPPGGDARSGARLFRFDDGLYRRARRAGADGASPGEAGRARHRSHLVPPVVGLHLDRRQALCVPSEHRQVPRRERLRARLRRGG
ncbi:hypothetical protein OY671_012342, partial [Metschnikowia pulcherrima]